jgi:hypothetical protein
VRRDNEAVQSDPVRRKAARASAEILTWAANNDAFAWKAGVAMKWFIGLAGSFWLICGLIGAWWLGSVHIETIAKGPISLAKAYNDNPVNYPGPN